VTKEELIAILLKQLEDPVRMAEILKEMQEHLSEIDEREEAYRIEQRRLWDKHKHDTYY